MEVEHVKANRSKKEVQLMSLFEQFITEGSEKSHDLAKEGAMLDGGDMTQVVVAPPVTREKILGLD